MQHKLLSVLLYCLTISGCQSTAVIQQPLPTLPEVSQTQLPAPVIPDLSITSDTLQPASEQPSSEQPLDVVPLVPNSQPLILNEQNLSLDAFNRQVCKNGVNVTYLLPDANGYNNQFYAKVQLQGLIKGVSADESLYKLQINGWYPQDDALEGWYPYLKQLPVAKELSLEHGSIVWDNKAHWYFCDLARQLKSL